MRWILPSAVTLAFMALTPDGHAQDARPTTPSDEDRKLDESLRRASENPDAPPPRSEPPPPTAPPEKDEDQIRLKLSALAAHWSARILRATATGRPPAATREQPTTTFLDESYGVGNSFGQLSETQMYRAFVGVHFPTRVDLGLELATRSLLARDGRAVPFAFNFAGHDFPAGAPVDSKLEYRCVDADCVAYIRATNWFQIEGGFGVSYLYTHVQLRDVSSGNGVEQSLESLALMLRFGVAVRPVHTDTVSVELFARARFGGTPGTYQCGLVQTELGVSVVFFDSFGIILGHHLELAQLERHLATVSASVNPITDKRAEIAAAGPFLGVFAQF